MRALLLAALAACSIPDKHEIGGDASLGQDGKSIENVSQYTSSIDVHYSSGVPNKSFCLASKRLSSGSPTGDATKDGVKRAAQAYFLANASYWTSGTTFQQACQGVLDAARFPEAGRFLAVNRPVEPGLDIHLHGVGKLAALG